VVSVLGPLAMAGVLTTKNTEHTNVVARDNQVATSSVFSINMPCPWGAVSVPGVLSAWQGADQRAVNKRDVISVGSRVSQRPNEEVKIRVQLGDTLRTAKRNRPLHRSHGRSSSAMRCNLRFDLGGFSQLSADARLPSSDASCGHNSLSSLKGKTRRIARRG